MTRARLLLLAVLLGAGCDPTLYARSAAPPGRTARLDEVRGFWGVDRYRLALSTGVAFALSCEDGGPCDRLAITSDDPAIADVRLASLGLLEPSGLANQATVAGAVIIGKAPGTTRVRVRARTGSRTIDVTVLATPTAGAPTLVAR